MISLFLPSVFRDPVQLNLLYEQYKQAIKNGIHPVTMDIATQLAAYMLQVTYGDHDASKHAPSKIKYLINSFNLFVCVFQSDTWKKLHFFTMIFEANST